MWAESWRWRAKSVYKSQAENEVDKYLGKETRRDWSAVGDEMGVTK